MKISKKIKHAIKNIKIISFLTLFIVVVPIVFYYSLFKAVKFIELRDNTNYQNGFETGYWEGGIEATTPTETLRIPPNSHLNIQADRITILLKLAQIESYNGKVRKILDTNGLYSLGLYHFQARTVKDMYRRYYKKNITTEEAVEIAQNDDLSTNLAYDAIFVKSEQYHWHNSMLKMSKQGIVAYKK